MSEAEAASPDLERIAATFRNFGEHEAPANRSALYQRLSFVVADDPELCRLAGETQRGQPQPNMLFAAVQYLLENQPGDPLAAYYPSVGGHDPADPGPAFTAFCEANREAIIPILKTRMVQTNEVRRSALLLPAFATIAAETARPLALIEIGPSAGLNLLFDRYRYDYGGGLTLGDAASPVLLDCESRGAPLPLAGGVPAVASRCGIDLNPLDVTDAGDLRWLKALVWPEHDDRRGLLTAAGGDRHANTRHGCSAATSSTCCRGRSLRRAPGAAVCIFATFVFVQFSHELLAQLEALILDLSRERDIHMVVLAANRFGGVPRQPGPDVSTWLMRFSGGRHDVRDLATSNPHGRWTEWRKVPAVI